MDNLQQLVDLIDQDIDPNGSTGSILAANHNNILKDVINKVGKWNGSFFIAHRSLTNITSGKLSFQSNALNNTSQFTIKVAKLSADLIDIGAILNILSEGSILKFKDFEGRTALFEFVSYSSGVDGNSNNIYNVVVKGFSFNPNYTYQSGEFKLAVLDFVNKKKIKKRPNHTITASTYQFQIIDDDRFLIFSQPCTVVIPNGLSANLEFQGIGDIIVSAESGGTLNYSGAFINETFDANSMFGIRTMGSDVSQLTGTLKLS